MEKGKGAEETGKPRKGEEAQNHENQKITQRRKGAKETFKS